jgi:hypothetical protein
VKSNSVCVVCCHIRFVFVFIIPTNGVIDSGHWAQSRIHSHASRLAKLLRLIPLRGTQSRSVEGLARLLMMVEFAARLS